jgi:Tfp pilus assembly protein PilX
MEQLISRRLPARRAQSGVALIMVLIMLTAMAIAGVALVRVVDSANVISGNFAFRQSTLNIADLGVEAAAADLVAIPAAAKGALWPVGCAAPGPTAATSPSVDQPAQPQLLATLRFHRDVGSTARACRSGATQRPSQTRHCRTSRIGTAMTLSRRAHRLGYAIRYVIDRQCNVAAANPQ